MTETVRDIEKNLPTDWILTSFENILSEPMRNGIYKKKDFHGRGVKVVNMGELFLYDFIENQDMKKVELTSNEIDKYCLKEGDLLFARRSLILEGSGKCSIVRKTEELTTFESSIIRARPNKDKVSSGYLFYLFKSTIGRDIVQSIATRTAVSGIRGSELAKLVVPIPPKSIQFKITSILSAYDYLIENNLRRIKILEEMAQNLYREWFVNFRFPGHENARFVDSSLGKIPEGWDIKHLKDISKITMGQSPKSEFYNSSGEGLPFHQGVTNFGMRFPKTKNYCTIEKRIANKGDILFSVRAPVGRINIADTKLIIGRGLSAIRHNSGWQWFLYHLLSYTFHEEDTIGGGTIFKSVTKSDMEQIKILYPQEKIIEIFEALVLPIEKQIETYDRKNITLRQTRDLLLPKLISGEVDVSELDIKVPEEAVS